MGCSAYISAARNANIEYKENVIVMTRQIKVRRLTAPETSESPG